MFSVSIACLLTTASIPTAGSSAPESTPKLLGIWRNLQLSKRGARQSSWRRAARPRSDAAWRVRLRAAVAFYTGFRHTFGWGWAKRLPSKKNGVQIPRSVQDAEDIQIYVYVHTHADLRSYTHTETVTHTLSMYLHTHTQNTHIPYESTCVCVCVSA